MIRVIATVTLKKGKRKEFLDEMYKIIPMVHIETGCIEYAPYLDADTEIEEQKKLGLDKIAIIERWQNLKSLKKHIGAPHMTAFHQATKEYVQSTQIMILSPAR